MHLKAEKALAGSVVALLAAYGSMAHCAALPCAPPLLLDGATINTPACVPIDDHLPAGAPAWLQGKSIYQWVTLQSPSTSGVAPNPLPPGITGIRSVTDAWGGGAVRSNGSYYILHGGGHGDYGGNEIYALKLSDENPTWKLIWQPTPTSQILTGAFYYADGNPASMHSFYFLQFNDATDRLMRFSKTWYVEPAGMTRGVDAWQWGAANWMPSGSFPSQPTTGGTGFANGAGTTLDASGNAYMINEYNWYTWNRASNTWSQLSSSYARESNAMVFDSKRNVVWSFGGAYSPAGTVLKWNVSNNAISQLTLAGASAAQVNGSAMGAAYDPVADKIFIYPGTGLLYQFNPETLFVTVVPTGGAGPTGTAGSGTSANLPWNKFRYVPALGGVVFQPVWSAPTYFIRTH